MIGIHDSPGSFSDRWIEACLQQSIPFRRINCLSTDIIHNSADLDVVLWHWNFNVAAEPLVARQILASLEERGTRVYPNLSSCWHFDDKVAQKYLLEAIEAPLIPTWVFTTREEASSWIANATWPKVFKLRCGAGSSNVRLVHSRQEAEALCRQAFGTGFHAHPSYLADIKTRLRKAKSWQARFEKLKRAPRTLLENLNRRRFAPRERGYLYFQEFLPDNTYDTRITIIGQRAFGFVRHNRPNDFRASGSGNPGYDRTQIDPRTIEIAFSIAERLGTQTLAFDFLFDSEGEPKIGEISYCFCVSLLHDCRGYWDRQLQWHEGQVWPQDVILEDMLAALSEQKVKSF